MSGHLIYVMGPSGAGKDSLLAYARARLGASNLLFAHRYITRAADAGSENHVALSPQEFEWRAARGLFALQWSSHDLHYGVGIEILAWLERGANVVVNGSRGHFAQALQQYPDLAAIVIDAHPEVLAQRLAARGRESAAAIGARLARQPAFELAQPGVAPSYRARIDNSATLAQGGAAFLAALQAACTAR
jgi:ribose 1,5-bisphosphokinase